MLSAKAGATHSGEELDVKETRCGRMAQQINCTTRNGLVLANEVQE
jgi:hypothetical protein